MKRLKDLEPETRRWIHSLIFPFFFLFLIISVWITEQVWDADFSVLGIRPRTIEGLKGIFLAPLIHGDAEHLLNNALPLFLLMWALFYFYRILALRIFLISWVGVGVMVWFAGRDAYHIGASGIIYALAAFLFFSGILRKHIPLMAISMLIAFLYGSMVWGMFPMLPKISWESHMLGAVIGIFLSIWYRNQGPQRPPPSWEETDDDEDDEADHTKWPPNLDV